MSNEHGVNKAKIAADFRKDKAVLATEMAKSRKVGDKLAAIIAGQKGAQERIEAMDDEKFDKEVGAAIDALHTVVPSDVQSEHFMNPGVGKSVGDAFNKFEGQESLGKLTRKDIEAAVNNGIIEESEGA